MWRGYSGFTSYFHEHSTVNHLVEFLNKENNVHTNTIEGNWGSVKMQTPSQGRTKRNIEGFLVRYMIKRNYRGSELEAFIKLLLL